MRLMGTWTGRALMALALVTLVAGCARGPKGLSAAEQAVAAPFVGVWEDQETGSRTTVTLAGGQIRVAGVVDRDGEVFPVRQQEWTGSGLTWVYFVPSTEYLVTIEADGVEDGRMHFRWSNHESAGEDWFLKVD
jgi:hypothetical protein